MTLRVIGAGLPRTGTSSLRTALELLLGAPCYHMKALMTRLEDTDVWLAALRGDPPDWDAFLGGFAAGVDWPFACFWRELSERYPGAVVLLSRRADADEWYASANATVLHNARRAAGPVDAPPPRDTLRMPDRVHAAAGRPEPDAPTPEQRRAAQEMWKYMGKDDVLADPHDEARIKAGYERHLARVRAEVPAGRLVEWAPGDGWEPLCAALGVPVPDEPFPHENKRVKPPKPTRKTVFRIS